MQMTATMIKGKGQMKDHLSVRWQGERVKKRKCKQQTQDPGSFSL